MATCRSLLKTWILLIVAMVSGFSHTISYLDIQKQTERLAIERRKCEQEMASTPYTITGVFCNRTWDNVMCWPDTPAGEVAYQNCPDYINGFDHAESATKQCLLSGDWTTSNVTELAWTNYTLCIKGTKQPISPIIRENMPRVQLMYTIGYSLSLTALILAVAIVLYFRRLRCPRNMIHLNLFIAYMLRAVISLMKEILLVNDLGFDSDVTHASDGSMVFNKEGLHWECRMFFTMFNYVIMVSVIWIFNEGLYLMIVVTLSVFAEKIKVRWFVLIGWGMPLLFVIPWALSRHFLDNSYCWNVHANEALYWIIRGPIVVSVLINFLFFINIIRVLITKLTASNCPESRKFRRLAKSTLILIPLFAVYYMGFIWLPKMSDIGELVKMYIELVFNSFQGLLVAFLFCFLNNEVQAEIKKRWKRIMLQREGASPHGQSTHSFFNNVSLHHNRDITQQRSHHAPLTYSDVDDQPIKNQNGHLPAETEEYVPLREQTSTFHDGQNGQEASSRPLNGERTQKGYLTYHSSR
ncbi:secretin receptor-like isoform X2 [Gigantopelta aegis]|uniref:secretin receptor-like isoform X2 n=1 Tax=Gigantopelta aegis TaxID=1735272 RepID=UPI001B88AA7B|nr:secretin receptor-like isoform X2 [Gigantopelta aegis]